LNFSEFGVSANQGVKIAENTAIIAKEVAQGGKEKGK